METSSVGGPLCWAAVLAIILGACSQAPPSEGPRPPHRGPGVPPLVESWYKVLQDGSESGFVHEVLRRNSGNDGYSYSRDAATKIKVGASVHVSQESQFAFLDLDFRPRVGSIQRKVDGQEEYTEFEIPEDSAHLTFRSQPGDVVGAVDPSVGNVSPTAELLLYAMCRAGALQAPGLGKMEVLDRPLEGRRVLVSELAIRDEIRRDYFSGSARVIPVVFRRGIPGLSITGAEATAYVDRYGRMVEADLGSGLRLLIAGSEADVKPWQYGASGGCWKSIDSPAWHVGR